MPITKEYNKKYYQAHKDKRLTKVKCSRCGRSVCAEYLKKHKTKNICMKHQGIENGENVKIE